MALELLVGPFGHGEQPEANHNGAAKEAYGGGGKVGFLFSVSHHQRRMRQDQT